MKSVMLSIRPQWCEKITSGKKTIEVRKSAPKEVPCRVFIYCTKEHANEIVLLKDCKNRFSFGDYRKADDHFYTIANGEVIGEFICDNVEEYRYIPIDVFFSTRRGYFISDRELAKMCLSYADAMKYGKGKTLYGWHISDLKIYDKPKELSEFIKSGFMTEEEWLFNLYPNTHCHYEAWAKKFEITRPPQSWCYVEELK